MVSRLERAKMRLEQYYEAEMAILSGQEYSIEGRSLKRADLGQVRSAIANLEKQVLALSGTRRVFRVTPID